MVSNAYSIDIFNLKHGKHRFEFLLEAAFFEFFGSELLENGRLQVAAELQKSETMLQLNLQIAGTIELECDRSLQKFEYPVDTSHRLYFKFGDAWDESGEDIIIVPRNQSDLDLSQFMYDFVVLEVPARKLHPDHQEEETDNHEGEIYYSTDGQQAGNEKPADPRWEKLKKLKFKS